MTAKTQDPKPAELAAWRAATDAAALAPNDPETAAINRAAGDAIEKTHTLPGGWYSAEAYAARAAIWAKLARELTARRFSVMLDPARAAKTRADEAIAAHYAAGKTPSDYARANYRTARENLALAEQDARDAAGTGTDDPRAQARAAANLPRTAEAARVQFIETIDNL